MTPSVKKNRVCSHTQEVKKMKRKTSLSVIAIVLVLAMVLTGCGSKDSGKVPALKEGEALELTKWSMNATAWSSPNGATVNLTAVPNGYLEGQRAEFCVRLEGEEVSRMECAWDGSVYTAYAELNAADGYCYFVVLTAADGTQSEVAINTPTAVTDKSLIDMQSALNSYCEATISASKLDGDKLVVENGSMKLQLPWLTLDEGAVTCQEAVLVLTYNGEDFTREELTMPDAGEDGICEVDLSGMHFNVPGSLEDDHQLSLRLDVKLSNGYTLTAPAGTWYFNDGNLVLAVG